MKEQEIKELRELKEAINKLYLANDKKEMALSYYTYTAYLKTFPYFDLIGTPDLRKVIKKDKRFKELFREVLRHFDYKQKELVSNFLELNELNSDVLENFMQDETSTDALKVQVNAKYSNDYLSIDNQMQIIREFFKANKENKGQNIHFRKELFTPDYFGYTFYNYLNTEKTVIMKSNLKKIFSLTATAHELGHVIDFTNQQKRFNNYEILNSLSSPYSEIVSTYYEKKLADYLLNKPEFKDDADLYEI